MVRVLFCFGAAPIRNSRLQDLNTAAAFSFGPPPGQSTTPYTRQPATEQQMKKIVVIGATGTLGQAVSAELKARHEVIEAGERRGRSQLDRTAPATIDRLS